MVTACHTASPAGTVGVQDDDHILVLSIAVPVGAAIIMGAILIAVVAVVIIVSFIR